MKGKFSRSKSKGFTAVTAFLIIALVVGGVVSYYAYKTNPVPLSNVPRFSSCSGITATFKDAQQKANLFYMTRGGFAQTLGGVAPMMTAESAAKDSANGAGVAYSETNIQVAGVDEADIVKTDGEYIYTLPSQGYYGTNSTLVIAKAYPADDAAILSETDLGEFYPQEIFIHNSKVLIFGSTSRQIPIEGEEPVVQSGSSAAEKMIAPDYYPYRYTSFATVQIWDVSDKTNPSLIRSVDFEGSYVSSRKIGPDVYFIVNSYPQYWVMEKFQNAPPEQTGQEIIPLYRDRKLAEVGEDTNYTQTCGCDDVAYFEPVNPQNFITVASISMENPELEVKKEVIIGSGQNIYASLSNLYIAEQNYPFWLSEGEEPQEKTIIHKFSLSNGAISYVGKMEAPGHILNQFSMDEYDSHFRIATTVGRLFRGSMGVQGTTSNNIYIFADDLSMSGKIENIAPGESIYSARFMGARGYLVTFKKIDPFFVLDLSDHANPKILGKLKIPGYSDYLHPYDENHIIGIGKEAVDAESQEGMPSDFAWYQGVKIALFDVTDVANPVEMHKVVIGDRGTDSYALQDHKAFLFDREKNLLVVPILLAELTDAQKQETQKEGWWPPYGEYVYQGAYVYDLTLENGFVLKGRITHYDANDQTFMKSGYYYYGDQYSVKRSLYIGDVLYTVSGKKIKLNALSDLTELKELVFQKVASEGPYPRME
jgi:inhibitor of cysteine peptidase